MSTNHCGVKLRYAYIPSVQGSGKRIMHMQYHFWRPSVKLAGVPYIFEAVISDICTHIRLICNTFGIIFYKTQIANMN